jgi:outer membrane protein OmpA-like peptidoglycan-associated protein
MKEIFTLILIIVPFFSFGQHQNCSVLEDVSFTIGTLDINSTASEFGPAIVQGNLWFSAFNQKNIKKINRGITDGVFYDLFSTEIKPEGSVSPDLKPQTDLSEGLHEGPVAFCEKTGELFVTLSNSINPEIKTVWIKQNKNTRLRIVMAKFENDKWVIKEEMPFNNPVYSVGHPSITLSGDTMYFTSDIPDYGIGGTDIYMSIRKNGKWGSPINLGETINTKQNEMFPVYYPDGTLVFASNGHPDGKGGLDIYYSCKSDKGFSAPRNLNQINSSSDDFGLVLNKTGETGYFTSNRPGYKGDDDIFMVTIKKVFYDLKGIVLNESSMAPIPGAVVKLNDCNGVIISETKSGNDGKFSFKAPVGKCLKVKASEPSCNEVTKDVGQLTFIELRLRCGCNLDLATLDIDNLKPIVAKVKFCDNQVLTSGDGGIINLHVPCEYSCLVTAESDGYLKTTKQITIKGKSSGSVVRDTVLLYKAQINKTFRLENIYYDYDKWDILPASETELNKLVKILQDNPSLKVELGSHTDSRGSDSYNKLLSQKRSDSAVGYILKNGIPKDRIVAKGYGESILINKCKNGVKCSDDEHRQNRRTEFKILSL